MKKYYLKNGEYYKEIYVNIDNRKNIKTNALGGLNRYIYPLSNEKLCKYGIIRRRDKNET